MKMEATTLDQDNIKFLRFFFPEDVEMTPTTKEIIASYKIMIMCEKKSNNILTPRVWDHDKIKEELSQDKVEWMNRLKGKTSYSTIFNYQFGCLRAL